MTKDAPIPYWLVFRCVYGRADDPYQEDEYCFRTDPDARASLSCSASSLTSAGTSASTEKPSFPEDPSTQDLESSSETSHSSSHVMQSTQTTRPPSDSINGINLLQEGTANQISSLNEIIGSEDSSEGLKEELGKLVDLLNGLASSLTWSERRKQRRRP